MSNDKHKDMQVWITNIVRQMLHLDRDALRAMVSEGEKSAQEWDALGSLMHPTLWNNSQLSGQVEHADAQLQIIKLILDILEQVDRLNEAAAQNTEFQNSPGGQFLARWDTDND